MSVLHAHVQRRSIHASLSAGSCASRVGYSGFLASLQQAGASEWLLFGVETEGANLADGSASAWSPASADVGYACLSGRTLTTVRRVTQLPTEHIKGRSEWEPRPVSSRNRKAMRAGYWLSARMFRSPPRQPSWHRPFPVSASVVSVLQSHLADGSPLMLSAVRALVP